MSDLEAIKKRIAAIMADLKTNPDKVREIERNIERDHAKVAEAHAAMRAKPAAKPASKNAFGEHDL